MAQPIPNLAGLRAIRRILNSWRLQRQSNQPFAIEINATNGFFAQLNWCLYILAYCEKSTRLPLISLTSPTYSNIPNHDWFHDFFDDLVSNATPYAAPQTLRIAHINETTFARQFSTDMTLDNAHRLFTTYYRVKPFIQSYVDAFLSREFGAHPVIGLHFRGTDKVSEAPPVDWLRCFRSVMKYAADNPSTKKAFISSDDPKFVDWFAHQAAGTLYVVIHPDHERSRDGQAVHSSMTGNNSRKGFEALVNCLLLSHCTALIRTASFLSGWCSVFRPSLPITMLNAPFAHACWFPYRECLKRSDPRYFLP
jgi:hypothetical protein